MNAKQFALPFRIKRLGQRRNPNLDLLNRSYTHGDTRVTVIGLCAGDDSRVMVQRDIDGRSWSMPAWLMRLIFMEKKRKRAA